MKFKKITKEAVDGNYIGKIMNNNTILKNALIKSFDLIEDNVSDPLDVDGIARALKQLAIDTINKIADGKKRNKSK